MTQARSPRTKRLEEAVAEIREMNKRLSEGMMFFETHIGLNSSEELFRNIEYFGFDRSQILVLSLTPDGNDTVIGRFITSERSVYRFDLDLDDCAFSTLTKVPAQQTLSLEEVAAKILFDERA